MKEFDDEWYKRDFEDELKVRFKGESMIIKFQHITNGYTVLLFRPDKPLYVGLSRIHAENPLALPRLISNLENYKGEHEELDDKQKDLIDNAITGLKELIEPEDTGDKK